MDWIPLRTEDIWPLLISVLRLALGGDPETPMEEADELVGRYGGSLSRTEQLGLIEEIEGSMACEEKGSPWWKVARNFRERWGL